MKRRLLFLRNIKFFQVWKSDLSGVTCSMILEMRGSKDLCHQLTIHAYMRTNVYMYIYQEFFSALGITYAWSGLPALELGRPIQIYTCSLASMTVDL